MHPLTLLSLLLILVSCVRQDNDTVSPSMPDLAGPIGRPTSGYGADGSYSVARITFASPVYSGKNVEIFYPAGITAPRPVIFYSHPFGGEESSYNSGLFTFLAKKGYVVVFAPYPTLGVTIDERYNTLWQSFKKALTDYPDLIDRTRVGFMGHSFGGGASFALAYKGFVDEGWGQNGRFIFSMAPWYSHQLGAVQLKAFPINTKLLLQVYDDDVINDHRLAIDLFRNINVLPAEKDFVLIRTSRLAGYTYVADHSLPNSRTAYDAYDYYGVYRLVDALADYSFTGNAAAKNVALGNGSPEQITMPSVNGQSLAPLVVTDNPTALYPQSRYQFPCNAQMNPRVSYCD